MINKKQKETIMQTLDMENPQNKTIFVILTKKEHNAMLNEQLFNLCEDFLDEHQFDFVTVDLEGESIFNPKSLVKIIGKCPVESHGIDIPSFAKSYLQAEIDELNEKVQDLAAEYETIEKDSFKAQNLDSWIAVLKSEIIEKESKIDADIKPKWIVKRIIDLAAKSMEDEVHVLHFCPERMLESLKVIFDGVAGVKCAILDSKKKALVPSIFN
jgi:hypothetical protein